MPRSKPFVFPSKLPVAAVTWLSCLVLSIWGCDALGAGSQPASRAHWLEPGLFAWDVPPGSDVSLHASPDADLTFATDGVRGGQTVTLQSAGPLAGAAAERFRHLRGMPTWRLDASRIGEVPAWLRGQVLLEAGGPGGSRVAVSGVQMPGVLDLLFAHERPLGPRFDHGVPSLHLWAPTARRVELLLFPDAAAGSPPSRRLAMQPDPGTGTWSINGEASWNRAWYLFEVEVYVPATGRFEVNRVTDPYSLNLSMDSRRSQIVNLDDPDLQPPGWGELAKPPLAAPEDIVIYELHVRDFSIGDRTVSAERRGRFGAFAETESAGARHLENLARAGLTHVHLLPAFDCATIEEDAGRRREAGDLSGHPPNGEQQQAAVGALRERDGFNWCYDPFHFTVPEGSYASAPDGVARIREFRAMVQALNRAGLRVVMDVVYNHTAASGQDPRSVLDRIVPGYYHRLDAEGRVERSTCCANTATEHAMMERLMLDSLETWARAYRVDGFRFDLMGHHSRGSIERARDRLQALTPEQDGLDGRSIYLYGEGWNFGEVANDSRFEQASQANMGQGTGVGTFNDRIRDAIRGGAHDDRGLAHVRGQGFVNGLFTAPNEETAASAAERERLLALTDLLRAGLAGGIAEFAFVDRSGSRRAARALDYHGAPAAYASDPQETVNYAAAHDNETLFDINQYKLPRDDSPADRARAANLANSLVMLAQGVPFFHAGQDLLRSKSLDRNSFDSGDWFNALDFSLRSNGWGRGLPLHAENADNWPVARKLLGDARLSIGPEQIGAARSHFLEMLAIRRSSPLFRLRDGAEIRDRLAFHNTGPEQVPGLVVMSLSDDAGTAVVVLFNAAREERVYGLDTGAASFLLHPVQRASHDPVVRRARHDGLSGTFEVPGLTTAVFIREPGAPGR